MSMYDTDYSSGPTHTWACVDCGTTVERYRGESSADCTRCSATYNAFGQRLRDDWRGNPSNYDDDISDLDGYEMQFANEY